MEEEKQSKETETSGQEAVSGAMTGCEGSSEEYAFTMNTGIETTQMRAYFRVWDDRILMSLDNFDGIHKPPDYADWNFSHKSFLEFCDAISKCPTSFFLHRSGE